MATSIVSELFAVVVVYAAVFLWLRDSRPSFRRHPSGVFVPSTDPVHTIVVLVLVLAGLAALMVATRSTPVLPMIFFALVAISLMGALTASKPQEGRLAPDQLPPGVVGPAYAEEPATEPEGVLLGVRIAATAVGGLLVLKVMADRVVGMIMGGAAGDSGVASELKAAISADTERALRDPRVVALQKRLEATRAAQEQEAAETFPERAQVPAEGWAGPGRSDVPEAPETSLRQRASSSPPPANPGSPMFAAPAARI